MPAPRSASPRIGSFIGGIVSVIGLALVGPPLAELALRFGPTEMFSLMVLGLTMVVGLMGTSIVRGLVAMFFGLMLSTIGMDPISGALRFTFGQPFLISGIDLVTIAMGLFGLSEIFLGMENLSAVGKPEKLTGLFPKREELRGTSGAIFRGTWLGFFIGLIPGTSSAVPALLSYSIEKALSKTPERFGNGAIEGVAGPETANNSYCGGAMIPLAHTRYSELADHRHPARRLHHARTDAGADPVQAESGLRLGRHRQHVHRQCHAARS